MEGVVMEPAPGDVVGVFVGKLSVGLSFPGEG